MFRAPVLYLDDRLHELVHVRIRLDRDPPSRRRRRVLAEARRDLRCEVVEARVDDSARWLYTLTRPRFTGFVVRRLDDVACSQLPGAFDTRSVRVYDGDRLVAVSYFDVGARSLATILGLWDPDYARYSPGLYTMLEEMAWARARGMRFYYPGYVVPGMPGFDYKHRLGVVQILGADGRWRTRRRAPDHSPLADHATRRKRALQQACAARGIDAVPRIYLGFWMGRLDGGAGRHLRGMWHLQCRCEAPGLRVIEYLIDEDTYVACIARPGQDLPMDELVSNPALESLSEQRLLRYEHVLGTTRDPDEAARLVV